MKVKAAFTGYKQGRYALASIKETYQYFCESHNMLLLR